MNRQQRKEVVKTAKYYHFNVETDLINDCGRSVDAQATVCIGQFGEKFSLGISLCCPEDQFSRLNGRRRAMLRAISSSSAFRANSQGNNIEEAKIAITSLINKAIEGTLQTDKDVFQPWMKYNPRITPRGRKRNG